MLLALLALPCQAEEDNRVCMLVVTDTAGNQIKVQVANISSITFDNDIVDIEDGHAVVDLGLSVKWAYSNLDLDGKNMEMGPYATGEALYGWADPTGKKRSTSVDDYPNSSETGLILPPNNIEGSLLDIARVQWGSDWRLPTDAELKELHDCDWVYEVVNGTGGYRITGPNGKSIFLPCMGWRYGDEHGAEGTYGGYWSGTLSMEDYRAARCVAFNSLTHGAGYTNRYYGLAIRPVKPKKVVVGDVNNDGTVDITDANIIINIVLGKDDAANYNGRADLTGENVVDVADLNAILNIMLGMD